MAIPSNLQLNLGTYPNDGTGDDLYTAFKKVKDTFTLLDTELGITNAQSVGTVGQEVIANPSTLNNLLQLKKIQGAGGAVVTSNNTTVFIQAMGSVQEDLAPRLGGNFDLNGKQLTGGGNLQGTVWGLDVRTINDQLNTLLQSADFGNADLGTFTQPLGGQFDLGTF